MKKTLKSSQGFTLVELLLAVIMLGFVLTGLVQVFLQCSVLAELSSNKTTAMSEVQGKMEEIRNSPYSSIAATYNNAAFDLSQLTGKGIVYVDSTNADLLEIKIVACWQNKYGRVIGEDQNLDGDDEGGAEDLDGDGDVSSVAVLITKIAGR